MANFMYVDDTKPASKTNSGYSKNVPLYPKIRAAKPTAGKKVLPVKRLF